MTAASPTNLNLNNIGVRVVLDVGMVNGDVLPAWLVNDCRSFQLTMNDDSDDDLCWMMTSNCWGLIDND